MRTAPFAKAAVLARALKPAVYRPSAAFVQVRRTLRSVVTRKLRRSRLTGTEFPGDSAIGVRQVTDLEAAEVTELFALAFYDDPTWSWAFPDAEKRIEHHRAWWGLYVRSAIPYGWAWMTDDGGAASLWIPPGEPELRDEDEARVEPLLRELVGSHADDVLTLLDRSTPTIPDRGRTTT
jgi:hypothetical protein